MPNLRKAYFTGLVLLSLVQLFIASTPSHLLCLAMASLAAALTGAVLLRRETFVECPLSSLQVLMFSAVTQSVPLLATTLEWKSIAYNLELPVVTFAFIGGTQLVLLGTHAFYRRERGIQMPRKFLTSEVNQRLGLFVVPTVAQLWILGFVGLGAMVLGVAGAARDPSAAGDGGGTLLRLLDGFKPLAYAPFLVVVMPFFSSRVEFKLRSSHYVCVGLYFLVILALSLVVNSRGAFAAPLLMAAFLFALAVLLGKAKVRLNHAPFLCGAVLSCLVIAGPLSDLAAAMEIARAKRGTVSGFEVAQESLRIAFDRERLQAFREWKAQEGVRGGWDERYVKNPFLARFVFVKFHDNALVLGSKLSEARRAQIQNFSLQKILATLPAPVLRLIPVEVNKKFINKISMGDLMYYMVASEGAGGRRVGSFIGHGVILFGGALYFAVIALVSLFVYTVSDSLARVERFPNRTTGAISAEVQIAPIALLSILNLALMFSGESINQLLEFFLRGHVQTIVIYAGVFFFVRSFSKNALPRPFPGRYAGSRGRQGNHLD